MQEVALRAFRQFHALREIEAARSWLFTILMRAHLNRVRTTTRRSEIAMDDLDEIAFERALEAWRASDAPEDVIDRARRVERLEAAIDALEPGLRAVIWLADVEGFRQREVATMLGIPEGTVASRLYRARCEVRERLRPGNTERRTRREG